ncbi:SDR family NAD(P)-dependent oxidoreductase [Novosphingobium mangrovi (ex Huang et al. 2023)]|uniref:SDR family oxidoreductase n=1 Tax=Novosphingobium mangrovi (ex Huang et al. 2023) TaxID=2976432 RepID=A0ABT2I2B0_9SPHN|nr:SDR family oxidoreductase [Novosphingobium mangrovi (ex Huang et al. 2023)]MCT2398945.1 SDR family oxidoreductase [Novosphingobium mangrovi (ex Huang et al. 2023)]
MSAVPGTVVVTGAAGGMGKPAAIRFASRGRSLLLCDLHAEPLETLASVLRGTGVKVDVLAGDIAAPDFAEQILAKLGDSPISALVHTAGLSPTMADGERIFSVNYDATERLLAGLLPRFSQGACAVLISSVSAYMLNDPAMLDAIRKFVATGHREEIAQFVTDPGMSYAISKKAVVHLVEREAAPFGVMGVRIVSVAPGFIDTPMGKAEAESNAQLRAMIGIVPQGRMGHGDEIASVVEFLCSPGASYISGTDIRVDGGIIGHLGMMHAGQ